MSAMLNPVSAAAMTSVLMAFRGSDFNCLIHVRDPQPGALRSAVDAYQGVVKHKLDTPKILDAERGVVNFLGFGDQAKRANFESWLAFEYGWKALPRPVRAFAAYRNASASDYFDDTIKVFEALERLGWKRRRDDFREGSGFYKPGTPVTDVDARFETSRVRMKVEWRAMWEGKRITPNWVHVGGTPGCPQSVRSRFTTLIVSAELLHLEDRHQLAGRRVLNDGIRELLAPMVIDRSPLSLDVPGASAGEPDWPHCPLEFSLQ